MDPAAFQQVLLGTFSPDQQRRAAAEAQIGQWKARGLWVAFFWLVCCLLFLSSGMRWLLVGLLFGWLFGLVCVAVYRAFVLFVGFLVTFCFVLVGVAAVCGCIYTVVGGRARVCVFWGGAIGGWMCMYGSRLDH